MTTFFFFFHWQAAEIAIIIQQKKDLCFRETTPVASIEQAKDHLGAGKIFWASLGGVKEVQGMLLMRARGDNYWVQLLPCAPVRNEHPASL